MQLDFARDDGLLPAGASGAQGEPLGLQASLTAAEVVLEHDVKLAHVVLAEAILVPAADVEQQGVLVDERQFERRVPFRVEGAVDRGRRLGGVAQTNDEIGVGEAAAVLGGEIAALEHRHPQHQRGRTGLLDRHGALGTATAAGGHAAGAGGRHVGSRRRGCVLEAVGERQLAAEVGARHGE